jgi:cell division protein FtsL
MLIKILGFSSLVLFLISICFSFYFSQEIVHLNQQYQSDESKIIELNSNLQNLQLQYTKLSTQKPNDFSNYQPINDTIQN